MAIPVNGSKHLIPAYYSIYRPRKDERLSWPSWLTYSGWLTHISGHPSAVGRAQDRESSPARDRRSTTVPRHQLFISVLCHSPHIWNRLLHFITGQPERQGKHFYWPGNCLVCGLFAQWCFPLSVKRLDYRLSF